MSAAGLAPAAEGEPLVVRCARHPDVETALRCGRCETPICPRCMVPTPVGARCRACAGVKRIATSAGPLELLRGAAAGLGVALVGGVLLSLIPFLALIGPAAVGFFTGWAVSNAVRLRRGRDLASIAVVAFLLGQWLAPVVRVLAAGVLPPLGAVLTYPLALLGNPLGLIGILLGAFLAWNRAR